ncbi:hypothetical protein G9C85_16155 [Halorubellus sp. JP-L1]|uniref:hypothetical protein n=1 Tax=Halorubellus sp. JP-L1 TaxID=2715753 RepID=UPI0014084EF7|nr:hypothetical protein [Halorubellus sp. JP-L1]NHN43152.1 hypothetical protein [Halorubellus sp. JP-L1]
MADTKDGREKKAHREARAAELRVAEADVAAFEDDTPDPDHFEAEDADVDESDLMPYLVDDAGRALTIAADRTEYDVPEQD